MGHARHSGHANIATLSGGARAVDLRSLPSENPVIKFAGGYYLNGKNVVVPYP